MKKTIVVLGMNGMLGTEVVRELLIHGRYIVRGCDLPDFDIRKKEDVESVVRGVDAVINCAAYTNVDGAETDTHRADAINAYAVCQLGAIAARNGVHVVHVGTDFVFDGKLARPYSESDSPNPLSVYGLTKLRGERGLFSSGCSCSVVRVQWTYGAAGRNFITKLLERAKNGGEVKVVDDQIGSPTWTRDVAKILLWVSETRLEGLYHYCAGGCASRAEVARFILEAVNLPVEVVPCKTADFPSVAQRPLNSRFDCSLLAGLLPWGIAPWQDGMVAHLKEME